MMRVQLIFNLQSQLLHGSRLVGRVVGSVIGKSLTRGLERQLALLSGTHRAKLLTVASPALVQVSRAAPLPPPVYRRTQCREGVRDRLAYHSTLGCWVASKNPSVYLNVTMNML